MRKGEVRRVTIISVRTWMFKTGVGDPRDNYPLTNFLSFSGSQDDTRPVILTLSSSVQRPIFEMNINTT